MFSLVRSKIAEGRRGLAWRLAKREMGVISVWCMFQKDNQTLSASASPVARCLLPAANFHSHNGRCGSGLSRCQGPLAPSEHRPPVIQFQQAKSCRCSHRASTSDKKRDVCFARFLHAHEGGHSVGRVSRLLNRCLIDRPTHLLAFKYRHPVVDLALRVLLRLDPPMHFTGPAGLGWRLFGVTRSTKNPNFCTL